MRPESNGASVKSFFKNPRDEGSLRGPRDGDGNHPGARPPAVTRGDTFWSVEERVVEDRSRAGFAEAGDDYVLSLGAVALVLWRRLWIVLLTALLLSAAAVGIGSLQASSYESSIKILVGQQQEDGGQSPNLAGDIEGLQQLTLTMTEAADSRPVAEAVIERLDLRMDYEEFQEHLNVEQVPETQFVRITYSDQDPAQASRVANAIGEVFTEQVSEVSPSANSITATVWERAVPADEPSSPDLPTYGALAAALGLMLGVALAFLVERLDDRWQSPEEAERVSGVPTFATIPASTKKTKKKGD